MSRAQLTSTVEQNTGGAVAPFVAGKNKIINGDFGIWQRGTSFSTASGTLSNSTYTADRWAVTYDGTGSTRTVSQQAFTPGTAPVAGYESAYYWQYAQTVAGSGATYNDFYQRIEDVRTFAGQTVTVSFWAKVSSGTVSQTFALRQYYGGGGSVIDTNSAGFTVTSSWQRFALTVTLPSLSGATLGSGSWLALEFRLPTNTTFTYSLWGVQVEAGSVATPFTTASNTLQGELALCQRYYWRGISGASYGFLNGAGFSYTSSNAQISVTYPVTMRAIPSSVDYSSLVVQDSAAGIFSLSSITLDASVTNTIGASFAGTTSGMTTNRFLRLLGSGSTAYIGFSADL